MGPAPSVLLHDGSRAAPAVGSITQPDQLPTSSPQLPCALTATTQEAYDEAVAGVFDMLDDLESHLEGRQWLVGNELTEADIRLFVTAFRFDAAYVPLFRTNLKRYSDYPNLQAHLERMYAVPGVAQTCNLDAMRKGYASIRAINPTGIVPVGPPSLLRAAA